MTGGIMRRDAAMAAPLLHCEVAYAGTSHTIEANPVADPYPVSATPYLLTGEQHLYAGVVERELIYSCTSCWTTPRAR